MSKAFARFCALSILLSCCSISAGAQQPNSTILNLGDAVVTGFSGTVTIDPQPRPANKSPLDLTFINPDGPSARVVSLGHAGYVWDGRYWAAPKTLDVLAKDVGQVFGIALDDQTPPNIYLAASSAFGLQIVVAGRGNNPIAERIKKGRPDAVWMKGQFGLERQGGPGAIWKVDGATGAVSLFANVTHQGANNPGPGLGNLAYDSVNKQLFVSDLSTGMIHRIGLDGADRGFYDHGVSGRTAARLAPVPFNPAGRILITNPRFDSENPDTWGFTAPSRRTWGLAVREGRLYYSVVEGPQIWSVGIRPDGGFAADPRWELDVPREPGPFPVSDIVFSQKGAMILAQRAAFAGSYDYSAFTRPGEPRLLRYWLESPDDPTTRSRWIAAPEEYAVGFAGNHRNTNGGVDLGYGHGADGTIALGGCEFSLWTTAQNLRNNPALQDRLLPGGPLVVHGLQGSPAGPVRNFNEPPWTSYFVDYDDKFEDPRVAGHLGSVRILKQPCTGPVAAYGGAGYEGNAPYITTTTGCPGGPSCPPPPPPPSACFVPTGLFECNPKTGWVYKLTVNGPGWINSVTAVSLTPGVSTTGGIIPLNPANIGVSGPPGTSAVIEVCAFNNAAALSKNPYDCCRTKLTVTIPTGACAVRR